MIKMYHGDCSYDACGFISRYTILTAILCSSEMTKTWNGNAAIGDNAKTNKGA